MQQPEQVQRPTAAQMQRVSMVGLPGCGKTTVGRKLAAGLDVPFVELDSIFHQPEWGELSREDFRARMGEALTAPGWVVDGNYSAVRDLVWDRADTVVWLDLPRRLVMRRVILRTVRRAVTRERLWNGNREPLTNFYRLDPQKNIIRWAWVRYPGYVARYDAAMRDPAYAHLRFSGCARRMRSPRSSPPRHVGDCRRDGPRCPRRHLTPQVLTSYPRRPCRQPL